jgi:two-component system, NtrC family, nitrogen regulation sensor histidine kinase NtrY
MIYKSFNLLVIIRLVLCIGLAAGMGYYISTHTWDMAVFCILALIGLVWNVVYMMNAVNRKVTFFFDAIRNEDTTLHFPENVSDKSIKKLNQSFNKVNLLISEIKLSNEHNERFFREIMEHSATGLIAVDEHDYVILANESALNFIGLPHISRLSLLKQKRPDLHEALEQIVPGQGRTVKLLDESGLKVISLKVKRFQFGEKKYRIYSLSDIKTEIEENELDSWQKLIRVMTHEIMNSIAPITSLSNTLRRFFVRDNQPVELKSVTQQDIQQTIQGLDVIEHQGQSLLHFVDSYRKLAKIPKPNFKPIQIPAWIEDVKLLMSNELKQENIEFKYTVAPANLSLIGDERLLTQVLINLLNNSIDALRGTDNKKIEIKASDTGEGGVKIAVTDNGPGISVDDLEKIFIPFYTTKENGSGIGLSLTRQILRLHKATITATSMPGKNTVFTMAF